MYISNRMDIEFTFVSINDFELWNLSCANHVGSLPVGPTVQFEIMRSP